MESIKDFNFPELTGVDTVFSYTKTDKSLLQLAKDKGFYDSNTPYNKLFSKLFFTGGTLSFKNGIDKDLLSKAVPYLKAFMGSFEPKHEEKEAICALILSEICEPE